MYSRTLITSYGLCAMQNDCMRFVDLWSDIIPPSLTPATFSRKHVSTTVNSNKTQISVHWLSYIRHCHYRQTRSQTFPMRAWSPIDYFHAILPGCDWRVGRGRFNRTHLTPLAPMHDTVLTASCIIIIYHHELGYMISDHQSVTRHGTGSHFVT